MKKFLTLILIIVLLSPSLLLAGTKTINLAWNSNTEEDMAGYEVWTFGTPMTSNCTSVGNVCPQCMIKDVTHIDGVPDQDTSVILVVPDGEERIFYIRVLAYDTSNNQSECSDEINVKVDFKSPTQEPDNFDAKIKEANE